MNTRTWLTWPNGVTLVRLVLWGIFLWLLWRRQVSWAMAVFALSWALDGVDGYLARRLHQETHSGYLLDKVVDRLLLVGSGLVLLRWNFLPEAALLLFIKDVGAVPAVYIEYRHGEPIHDMGYLGKVSTLLQGLAVLWLVLDGRNSTAIIALVGSLGVVTAVQHLQRVIHMPVDK